MTKFKYSIYCEGGLLHSCDGYETEDEAIEEAEADISRYYEEAETEIEAEAYWYEVDFYEEEEEEDDE